MAIMAEAETIVYLSNSSVQDSKPADLRQPCYTSPKTSHKALIPSPSSPKQAIHTFTDDVFDDVVLNSESGSTYSGYSVGREDTLDAIAVIGLSFAGDGSKERFSMDGEFEDVPCSSKTMPAPEEIPSNKWLKSLQRRSSGGRRTISGDSCAYALEDASINQPASKRSHKKSSSGSSYGFVTAVRSASVSIASFSVAPRSRRTGISSRRPKTDMSSRASNAGRLSEDSSYLSRGPIIDQGVANRLILRRKILEEFIRTEENYVGDIKFLMNVYVTLLASLPSLSVSLRTSIKRNLNEIIELHEELLGELHKTVPHSEYEQLKITGSISSKARGHTRWHSLDAVPKHARGALLQETPGVLTAEPKIVADVAKIFCKRMNRFFIYEEYGAKYDFMVRDIATAYRTMPQWDQYQKGIEALASSLASHNSQHDNMKKALTIGDLLVKPIQRVCKYPLLFAELLKQTPVYDCPDSHMEIENVLIRLREATTEINRATDDPRMKLTMEKTWLLQDRLVFPDMSNLRSKDYIRSLGHIHVCGVLHVSWQTKDSVEGQYLICLLYRDFLIMAFPLRNEQSYIVQACIGLSETHIEEVDNGRGLQCHTAPFSWKLGFECDHQLYEITMTACSPREELEWRSRISDRSSKGSFDTGEQTLLVSLFLSMKPMGQVFGKPGTIARRISIHRATTVGPHTSRCQVIIKNTNAFKESASTVSINRSQSLLTTNRITVLAPPRAERIRLEALLTDVWTRDILPFPGMTGRNRSEHLVRASATSMMRKLSVASIASNFTKRSGSMASLNRRVDDDDESEDHAGELFMKNTTSRADHYSSSESTYKPSDNDRLSTIQDEKENIFQKSSAENLRARSNCSGNDLHRLATLHANKSWSHDGKSVITPPMKTSSANHRRSIAPRPLPTTAYQFGGQVGRGEEKHNKENSSAKMKKILSAPVRSSPSPTEERLVEKMGKRGKCRQFAAEVMSFFR